MPTVFKAQRMIRRVSNRPANPYPAQKRKAQKNKPTGLFAKVQQIMKRGQETKCAVASPYNSTSGNLATFVAFSQAITNTSETYALIPPISQGSDDHQRIGDQISPVSLTVRGTIGISPEMIGSTIITADVYFLTAKAVKSESVWGGVPITSLFLDANGGLASYDGTARNTMLPFNQDDFTLIKHKRFKFAKPIHLPNNVVNGGTGVDSLAVMAKTFTVKIPLPKTLKYATAANSVCQNAYPFMVIGWHYGDLNGSSVGNSRVVGCQAVSTLYYKDA